MYTLETFFFGPLFVWFVHDWNKFGFKYRKISLPKDSSFILCDPDGKVSHKYIENVQNNDTNSDKDWLLDYITVINFGPFKKNCNLTSRILLKFVCLDS